jgi:hypothetical protein
MYTYTPSRLFNTPFILMVPEVQKVKGVECKEFESKGVIFGSYVTFGGTERDINGLILQTNTGQVTTWYREDITAECQLIDPENPETVYEIVTEPENVERRNQYLQFRIKVRQGGA